MIRIQKSFAATLEMKDGSPFRNSLSSRASTAASLYLVDEYGGISGIRNAIEF
jgi:hypothetical protein